jgi:hypothetical protein
MKRLTDLRDALRSFRDRLDFEMAEITETEEARRRITEANVSQLYDYGRRADGREITPPYAESTIKRKRRRGQPTNRVTLRDTGAMHSRLQVVADDADLFLYSDRPYVRYLLERYGKEIFGLTEEAARRIAREVYAPALLRRLRLLLGK